VAIPRSSIAAQKPQHPQHSIAAAIQWRLDESRKPGARQMGDSWAISLRFLQRQPIAAKLIPDLIPQDFVDHCRSRIAAGRKPCTANHDMTAFRSTISDYIESNDLPAEWLMVFKKAKRRLNKEQLIGKSTPRTRLPTLEELAPLPRVLRQAERAPETASPTWCSCSTAWC
jgi:hypothetical protein